MKVGERLVADTADRPARGSLFCMTVFCFSCQVAWDS